MSVVNEKNPTSANAYEPGTALVRARTAKHREKYWLKRKGRTKQNQFLFLPDNLF